MAAGPEQLGLHGVMEQQIASSLFNVVKDIKTREQSDVQAIEQRTANELDEFVGMISARAEDTSTGEKNRIIVLCLAHILSQIESGIDAQMASGSDIYVDFPVGFRIDDRLITDREFCETIAIVARATGREINGRLPYDTVISLDSDSDFDQEFKDYRDLYTERKERMDSFVRDMA